VRTTSSADPALVVSIHDVAPATLAETRRWLADLDGFGIPGVLLAVPGPWRETPLADDPETAALLRGAAAAGHEIALHGWCHAAQPSAGSTLRRWSGGFAARGAGEFWTLDEAAARQRVEQGRQTLLAAGLNVEGFVPPGYLAGPGARAALAASGLRYWTSHFFVHDLTDGSRVFAPSVSHRPAIHGGAVSTAPGRPVLERAGELMIWSYSRLLPRPGAPLRLALHPHDVHRPGLREVTLRAIERALGAGARALTYGRLLDLRAQDAAACATAATP
jgi:predicted deacetylase